MLLRSFIGLTFLSAFLLFLIQPVLTKTLLPYLGGTPAVWNMAMVFFQFLLLLGYAYAHIIMEKTGRRPRLVIHTSLLLLSLVFLPISVRVVDPATIAEHPEVWLLRQLLLTVGLPFFLLATNAPLLQRAFSHTGHPLAHNPYRLYLASNAGSLIALLGFPFVIEPLFRIHAQFTLWSFLYAVFAVSVTVLLWRIPSTQTNETPVAPEPSPPLRTQLYWFILAAVPSALMLGVTTYITTDIAAVPLLWIIPLALYLLTFIIAFSRYGEAMYARMYESEVSLLFILALLMAFPMLNAVLGGIFFLHLCAFFAIAMRCHAQLAMRRPAPAHLTLFYLWMSLGGVVGSLFSSLLAPLIFKAPIEYPVLLLLAIMLRPWKRGGDYGLRFFVNDVAVLCLFWAALQMAALGIHAVAAHYAAAIEHFNQWLLAGMSHAITLRHFMAVLVLALLAFYIRQIYRRPLVLAGSIVLMIALLPKLSPPVPATGDAVKRLTIARNFFGIVTVMGNQERHMLVHGNTVHGVQNWTKGHELEKLTYYGVPIQDIFSLQKGKRPFAVIGLGVGTLACYGQKHQQVDFYEINPVIVSIAQNPDYFTYLRDCPPKTRIILGDGRLSLARAPDRQYEILLLDAFNSDAIPMHLLTREALDMYRHKIMENGIIAFHISNRHLNIRPVMKRLAEDSGMSALIYGLPDEAIPQDGVNTESIWVTMAEKPETLRPLLAKDGRWKPLSGRSASLWTDDFSNIIDTLY